MPKNSTNVIIYNFTRHGAIRFAQYVDVGSMTHDLRKSEIITPDSIPGQDTLWGHGLRLVHMGDCEITSEQYARFNQHIGKAIEIEYQDRCPSTGKITNPNFVRLQNDTNSKDCVFRPA
jgi:hypothetical protein